MPIESDGHSRGNPRMYELFENAPQTGKSPTVWAFGAFVDFLKVAGQPVQGPWPPHQQPRPDPLEVESGPVAVPDPESQHFPRRAETSSGEPPHVGTTGDPAPEPSRSHVADPLTDPLD